MFQHTQNAHHGLHIGANLKKAVNWYFTKSAELYVWSPKPMDKEQK